MRRPPHIRYSTSNSNNSKRTGRRSKNKRRTTTCLGLFFGLLLFLYGYNFWKTAISIHKEEDENENTMNSRSYLLGNLPKKQSQERRIRNETNKKDKEKDENDEYPFEFAACLLTKDDNIILPEWIAYHYTVLPLRYLIVAVDPLSITSPEPILELYRNYTQLKIETWIGNWYWKVRYWKSPTTLNKMPPTTPSTIIAVKRQRQKAFYAYCLQRLKLLNYTWTILLDTDEYFTYNSIMAAEEEEYNNNNKNEEIQDNNNSFALSIEDRYRLLPSTIGKQNETIAHWIHQYGNKQEVGITNQTFCAAYPRIQFFSNYVQPPNNNTSDPFGTTATTTTPYDNNKNNNKNVSFDRESFHTLLYTAHDQLKDGSFQGQFVLPSKAMVNAVHMKANYKLRNVHYPFPHWLCKGGGNAQLEVGEGWPFRIHQYSGSLKTFLSRPERTVEMWHQRNTGRTLIPNHYDQSLTKWFPEFVQLLQKQQIHDGSTNDDHMDYDYGFQLAHRLTQQAHDDAYEESMTIKQQQQQQQMTTAAAAAVLNQTNATMTTTNNNNNITLFPRPLYEWDRPIPDKQKKSRLWKGLIDQNGTAIWAADVLV